MHGYLTLNQVLASGAPPHKAAVVAALRGRFVEFAVHTHGTRVVQKVLEVAGPAAGGLVLQELSPHILRLVADSNGNYAVQALVTHLKSLAGVAVLRQLAQSNDWTLRDLASHPYGCRVVQRIIEHCRGTETADALMDMLCEHMEHLACETFGCAMQCPVPENASDAGCSLNPPYPPLPPSPTRLRNFCILHVATLGSEGHRSRLVAKLCADFLSYALHKNASNLVEKCLELCPPAERAALVDCVVEPSARAMPMCLAAFASGANIHPPPLLMLVQGQYGCVLRLPPPPPFPLPRVLTALFPLSPLRYRSSP